MKIFYNSSMPRAGSTLLQNILGQNPDFYVTPTSGLLELVYAARENYTNSPEFKAQDKDLMKNGFLSFCHEGMNGYFSAITDKPYIVDKSRGWGIHYDFLNQIQPNPKIVCIVRDLRDIISSMEKLYRKYPHISNSMVNHGKLQGTTIGKRVDFWLSTPPIGLALDRMQDIFAQGIYKNILFIRYEDLIKYPQSTMNQVYKYFEVPVYEHDFKNIEQITVEDDEVYGIYGDHKIRTSLERNDVDHNQILGKPICDFLKNRYSWYFNEFKYID